MILIQPTTNIFEDRSEECRAEIDVWSSLELTFADWEAVILFVTSKFRNNPCRTVTSTNGSKWSH